MPYTTPFRARARASRAPLLALGPPDHLRARPARADHLELRAAPAPPSRPLRRGSVRGAGGAGVTRSEEHTSELQSLMRIAYAVLCLKKKTNQSYTHTHHLTSSHRSTMS